MSIHLLKMSQLISLRDAFSYRWELLLTETLPYSTVAIAKKRMLILNIRTSNKQTRAHVTRIHGGRRRR